MTSKLQQRTETDVGKTTTREQKKKEDKGEKPEEESQEKKDDKTAVDRTKKPEGTKTQKKSVEDQTVTDRAGKSAEMTQADVKTPRDAKLGRMSAGQESKPRSDQMDGGKAEQQKVSSTMTLTDSTLHRIHGDIRISLKTDNPVRH